MKHALETQAALVNLARSLAPETVTVSGADGRLFFDSDSRADLDAAWAAFVAHYREAADGRRVLVQKRAGARVWRLVDSATTLRRMARIELTEEEHTAILAGAWYSRQADSKGGKGLKADELAGR